MTETVTLSIWPVTACESLVVRSFPKVDEFLIFKQTRVLVQSSAADYTYDYDLRRDLRHVYVSFQEG